MKQRLPGWALLGLLVALAVAGPLVALPEIAENSQLLHFIEGVQVKDQGMLDENNWFTVENLYFESESSDLKVGSEKELNSIAKLMKAYPTTKIKIGGYTDNTGNESNNIQLSKLRAQTAKLKLLEMGIAADRIETEGYGPQYPVCEANDTDDCKAQNRRIDIRLLNY